MRILLVTPWYTPAYAYGGIVRVAEDHARGLAARGYDVTVATTDAHDRDSRNPVREEIIDGVRVVRFPNLSNTLANRLNLYAPRGYDRWIRENISSYERVIAHDVYTWLTFRALRHAAAAGVPHALMPHGTVSAARIAMKHSHVKRWLLAKIRPYLRSAFAVYAISDAEREDILAVEPAARAVTLGNGIDLGSVPTIDRAEARKNLGISADTFAAIFLGRLHPLKRADTAIRAHALLRRERPGSVLLVAGPDDGALADLRTLTKELGTKDSVRFLGTLTGHAKFSALAAADVFISPSLDEWGRPLVVAEALACGLPCVLSAGCRVPEVAETGAGITVHSQDPADYALALEAVARDPLPYRARTAHAAREYFSLARVIDTLVLTLTPAHHDR